MIFRFCLSALLALSVSAFAQEKPAREKVKALPTPPVVPTEPTRAETPKPTPAATPANDMPAQVAAIFFGLLQKNQIDPAYEGLMKGSKIAERPEELKTLKSKTKEAIDVFGPIQNYELVETKNVGTHLLRRTYLSLNKEFPLRWRFYFYLSDNLWRLIDLRVDDRVTGMFDEVEEPKSALEAK
jgi:hypothetical protein